MNSFSKFALVSIISFAIDFGFAVLFSSFFIDIRIGALTMKSYQTSQFLATSISGVFNFLANRRFTFDHTKSIQNHAMRYSGLLLFNMLIFTPILLHIFVEIFHLPVVISLILRTAVLFFWNYFVNKYFTFL